MLLSMQRNMIFVKGKKVAGTSIEVHLAPQLEDEAIVTPIRPPGPPSHLPRNFETSSGRFSHHMPARKIAALIGQEQYSKMHSWGIIRHPVEKVLSFFYMQAARQGQHYLLDQAVRECPSELDRYCDKDGSLMVDTIIRYEELPNRLPTMLEQFDLSAAGFSSVREKSDYRAQYQGPDLKLTSDHLDMMRNRFAFDFSFYQQ